MRRRPSFLALSLAAVCVVLGALPAEAARTKAKASELPPLLDRELFFGDPEITNAQLSPDGTYLAFIKPLDGTRNVWVKRIEEPFDAARPVTADTKRPIPGYFWSQDGRFILFVQDQAGDENYNVLAVDPSARPAEGAKVPVPRNLTDLTGVRAVIYDVPKTQPDVIHVGLNDRDPAWHDLYRVSISTGERTLVRTNTDRIAAWIFDPKGNLRLAYRIKEDGTNEVLRIDDAGFTPVYTCSVLDACAPVRIHEDGRRLYMSTNKGTDLVRLTLFDPQSGAEEVIASDPKKRVDLGKALFSEKTDRLLATVYGDDRMRISFHDEAFEADFTHLTKKLGGDLDVFPTSMTRDERLWLVGAGSDVEPGQSWLYDRATKKMTLQYKVRDSLPREHLAPMQAIRYPSSDGREIPAFLTLPKGVPSRALPLVVFPHGGPWARDDWGYDGIAQFLANRGYAVLQPNFRGSTGYGKDFLNAGNNEWGLKMQDDLTWGVKHLVGKGIVDPKRVGIMGGSYGGYATLAGLTFTPDVYAAGVSIVGPSSLITLLESIPPYWEAIRTIFHHRMGDPGTPEGRALLERASPLHAATKIKTPLLVVQGANDPRVKKTESDQIVIALRDRGFPVEYLVAPDEGHGFARPINNLALFTVAERFLAKHLGGRFQDTLTPEIAAREREIRVDPKTVMLAKKVDAATVSAPAPVADLQPGTRRYQSTIAMGGQSMTLEVTREIAEENGRWVVTDTMKTPMGEGKERTTLEKGTLQVLHRTASQGPFSIDVAVEGGKAEGTQTMSGTTSAVAVDLGGPLFGDGAGKDQVLAMLPLATGYTTTFRMLDLERQKPKLMTLTVEGLETVTVPAGTFETWKVGLASAEGEPDRATLWVAREGRTVVKSSTVLPQMGGATLTTELTAQ